MRPGAPRTDTDVLGSPRQCQGPGQHHDAALLAQAGCAQRQGRIHRADTDDRALGLLERAAEGHAHICCALALKAKLDRKSQNSRGENSTGTKRTLNEHALIFLQTFGTRKLPRTLDIIAARRPCRGDAEIPLPLSSMLNTAVIRLSTVGAVAGGGSLCAAAERDFQVRDHLIAKDAWRDRVGEFRESPQPKQSQRFPYCVF